MLLLYLDSIFWLVDGRRVPFLWPEFHSLTPIFKCVDHRLLLFSSRHVIVAKKFIFKKMEGQKMDMKGKQKTAAKAAAERAAC